MTTNKTSAVKKEKEPEAFPLRALANKAFKTTTLYKVVEGQEIPKTVVIHGNREVVPFIPKGVFFLSGVVPGYRWPRVGPEGITDMWVAGRTEEGHIPHNVPMPGDLLIAEIPKEELVKYDFLLKLIELEGKKSTIAKHRHTHTIGADPEIFAVDKEGVVVPAFSFLQSKYEAPTIKCHGRASAAAYWDGYQAEYSVQADTCAAFVVDSIRWGMKLIKDSLPEGASLTLRNVMEIPPQRLMTDEARFVNFGCSPSKSVYGEKFPKVDARTVPFRSAGGHLHFTLPEARVERAVKLLDRVLGVISVAMFRYWDTPTRRVMYGRAGEYRTPAYGFEYRVLSNAWLCHPAITHLVYEIARLCVGDTATKKGTLDSLWDVTEEEARTCINQCDVDLALSLLERNKAALRVLMGATPALEVDGSGIDAWVGVIINGAHKYLKNPDEPSGAWGLVETERWVQHSEGTSGCMTRVTPYLHEHNALD